MNAAAVPAQWLALVIAALILPVGAVAAVRAYRRRARRRALLSRLQRIALQAVHQVLVPDGMGGYIHVDHLLLTPRGVLILDTRRVAGVIFGGDQMSEWTVMARGRRYTFDNPQPALYDRIAAVKALVDDLPVQGLLVFSNLGKFAKGMPKGVIMLNSLEVEFAAVDRASVDPAAIAAYESAWHGLSAQLRASPHSFTNL
ncbi:MAG TPA: nuclease-related domain-containing protein [Steroidobacteraceae bacterium]|nr:nuclease-related domain-containing protein [Steroidobacteraceae bacterium]